MRCADFCLLSLGLLTCACVEPFHPAAPVSHFVPDMGTMSGECQPCTNLEDCKNLRVSCINSTIEAFAHIDQVGMDCPNRRVLQYSDPSQACGSLSCAAPQNVQAFFFYNWRQCGDEKDMDKLGGVRKGTVDGECISGPNTPRGDSIFIDYSCSTMTMPATAITLCDKFSDLPSVQALLQADCYTAKGKISCLPPFTSQRDFVYAAKAAECRCRPALQTLTLRAFEKRNKPTDACGSGMPISPLQLGVGCNPDDGNGNIGKVVDIQFNSSDTPFCTAESTIPTDPMPRDEYTLCCR